jgi:hydrogenase/urease accessory protein HupE
MRRFSWFCWFLIAGCFLSGQAAVLAHDIPRTQIELRLNGSELDAVVTFSVAGFLVEYPALGLEGALFEKAVKDAQPAMEQDIATRLLLRSNGVLRTASRIGTGEFLPDRRAIRLPLHYAKGSLSEAFVLETKDLFPIDPNHTVFVSIYESSSKTLLSESVLSKSQSSLSYTTGSSQSIFSVIRQFVREGIHHIFIGPDHLLFIIGLLLLGGTLKQLLRVITIFTVAHSITLAVATLNLFSPSPKIIEPLIALSIVFVGIQGLLCLHAKNTPNDLRLVFAFCFGLIHGFGFASVLRELELPQAALGWSLFSFNLGVELGQACLVLSLTLLLMLLKRRSAPLARRVVVTGLWMVVLMGAYWLGERV